VNGEKIERRFILRAINDLEKKKIINKKINHKKKHCYLQQASPQPSPLFGVVSTISTAFLNIVQTPDNSYWLRVISVEPQSLSSTTIFF
jgi:predicted transcriptional regulator